MKYLFFSAVFFASQLSFASDLQPARAGDWFCTAEGYNMQNQRMSVSGSYELTMEQARVSAVEACRMWGYSLCRAQSCFNLGT